MVTKNLTDADKMMIGLVHGKENKESMGKLIELGRKQIVSSKLTAFLKKVFPKLTKEEGEIIWDILENKKLVVNGEDITGTFRYNASCIAEVVGNGTDYCDFYCSWVHSNREEEFKRRMLNTGGKVEPLNL